MQKNQDYSVSARAGGMGVEVVQTFSGQGGEVNFCGRLLWTAS